MDVLKDKNYKSYTYTSRYTSTPYFYNTEDEKYIYGIGTQVDENTAYVAHKVKDTDNLDYLALKYYGNPTYYWVIAEFNNILNCYENLSDKFKVIKIPNISSIYFKNPR